MPRQNRRRPDAAPELRAVGSAERRETWRSESYSVRTVSGAAATKEYRCPGCDQLLGTAVPHVVAWPTDDLDASHRRHWHKSCWQARERRSPTR